MKLIQTVAAIVLLASPLALSAVEPAPLTVAVFDFESKDEGMRDLGPKLAALVTANLSGQPNLNHVATGRPQTLHEFAQHWWQHWGGSGKLMAGALPYRYNEVMRISSSRKKEII